jgi:phosphoribosylglycinamide formyltransferase-1
VALFENSEGDVSWVDLVVFASGEGTTLQTVIDSIENGELDARIVLVVSNKKNAGALKRAVNAGIDVYVINEVENRKMDIEVARVLEAYTPDLILLLGYLKRIGKTLIELYPNRIVNTHPALLPDFGGPGMYGNRVHEAVLAAERTESGVTLHYANEEYDRGPIIEQKVVKVEPDDTVQSLAQRVQEAEKIQLVEWLKGLT